MCSRMWLYVVIMSIYEATQFIFYSFNSGPTRKCQKKNEVYDPRGANQCTEKFCGTPDDAPTCVIDFWDGSAGACRCKDGFYRNKQGECVTKCQCTIRCDFKILTRTHNRLCFCLFINRPEMQTEWNIWQMRTKHLHRKGMWCWPQRSSLPARLYRKICWLSLHRRNLSK